MERMINRPYLQVCSRCYKDFLRYLGSTCSDSGCAAIESKSDQVSKTFSSWPTRSVRCGSFLGGNVKLIENSVSGNRLALIRHFATERPPDPRRIPNPLPPRKNKGGDDSERTPITWKNLAIVGGIAGLLMIGLKYVKQEKEEARQKAQNKKIGKAKLGGEWTLTDHHGKVRNSWDFHGQWLLIYFGFTNCPDICPEEIEKIVSVIEKTDADKDLPTIQPILITVDPTRDTPEALKEYCSEFSPRLLGFSGTEESIQAATRAYRVYYSAGPKDEDNDYIVDHSIISYLVNPEGEFVDYFGQNKKVEEIYSSTKLHILSYLKKKKSA